MLNNNHKFSVLLKWNLPDLVYPPRLAQLFVGGAVCKFFILMLKIINLKLKLELDW